MAMRFWIPTHRFGTFSNFSGHAFVLDGVRWPSVEHFYTGDEPLLEDSPEDFLWGTGRDGSGQNRLGVLLMELRAQLRGEQAPAD